MAVFTHLTNQDIAQFLSHYDVGVLQSALGIAEGIENTNYMVSTSDGKRVRRYILTVFERRVKEGELPFFMELTHWLADRGIPCPRPVERRRGGTIHAIKGKPAALVEFLEGKNNPDITPAHLTQVGELLARMHLASEGFPMIRRNTMDMECWKNLFQVFRNRAYEIYHGLEEDIAAELYFLGKSWPSRLPSGVIHADVFPDNVFFSEGGNREPKLSGIIDFYFACNDFWAYDLAICLNAWCFDANYQFVQSRARELFTAYEEYRPLSSAEKQAMPVLARGAALRFLMTRAHDWLRHPAGAMVTPKDPLEYTAKLHFHQQVVDWRGYGL